MKAAKNICKAIALIFSAAVFVLFFADFVVITATGEQIALTGAELAFGSTQVFKGADIDVARSSFYLFTFLFVAASALFAALSFKFKKTNIAALVTEIVTAIMAIIFLTAKHVDHRPLTGVTGIRFTWVFIGFCIAAFAAVIVNAAAILIIDAIETKTTGKKTIPQKIIRFLREYISEIRKVIWPGPKAVVRSTVIVLIMCVVAGAYVWVLDFGITQLFSLVFGVSL